MSIWHYKELTLEKINAWNKNTMLEHLGIEFSEVGDNYIKATMPVDERTLQPHGIMHGGASSVLAETTGSFASNCCLDMERQYSVGQNIITYHISMARRGFVTGIATPIHLGATSHIWEIKIYNEERVLVSSNTLTTAVINRPAPVNFLF